MRPRCRTPGCNSREVAKVAKGDKTPKGQPAPQGGKPGTKSSGSEPKK